jgi:late competence protein required for DNA uptake (superfamily II DNA/RNA helicase)
LPQKENKRLPLFSYEELLYNTLQNHKHVWVKKSTGLGITEFILRYMIWLALKDDTYKNAHMPIVCGPNIDIAIKLIKRIKNIFEPFGILFDTKETVIELNDCTIEAFPSNHLDAYRSLERPKFIFLDEADFFRASDQQDARDVSERYIAKSAPHIVLVSTPNMPGGLFQKIEQEPEETCLYKRLFLDYTYGLDKIYTREEIEKATITFI